MLQVKKVFLMWLPWVLCMSRPGRKITRKSLMISARMKELELKERSSKSLLANVLDIDDDFRRTHVGSGVPGGVPGVPNSAGGFIQRASTLEDASSGSPACPVAARDLQVNQSHKRASGKLLAKQSQLRVKACECCTLMFHPNTACVCV